MTKYIISSGTSIISKLTDKEQFTTIEATNEVEKALTFDTIGEAMKNASKVNNLLGSFKFTINSIEC